MDDGFERWLDQQENLPDHLQRWVIFERPRYIWLGRILMHIGLWSLGERICGLRFETDEERNQRLREFWKQGNGDEISES